MLFLPRKLRPAVKTHGGKYYTARRIIQCFPEHSTFVEPCAGGVAVLVNKPRSGIEVAGDLDPELMNLHQVIRDRIDELLTRIRDLPYREEIFHWACGPGEVQDPIERAVRSLVRNRFSRGGLGKDSAWSDRLRGGRPGDENSWRLIKAELPLISDRLQGVELRWQDGVELLKEFAGPDTLAYLDPPYVPETRTAKREFRHEMTQVDHVRLLETIVHSKSHITISGYHNSLYDGFLRDWHTVEWNLPNHSSQAKQKQRRIEVMWMNFQPPSNKEAVDRALAECS
jgi:DNA adenine methylase